MEEKNNLQNVDTTKEMVEKELKKESYLFSEIGKDISEDIRKMNIVELTKFITDLKDQIEQLDGAKSLIDSIKNMSIKDDLNKKIAMENVLNDVEFKEDSNKFLESYDKNKEYLESLVAQCDEEMKKFDGIEKTTSYLNDAMIEILERKINYDIEHNVDPESPAHKSLLVSLDAFKNRHDISYVIEKCHTNHAVRKMKRNINTSKAKTIKNAIRILSYIFKKNQIEVFRNCILRLFDNDENATDSFVCYLAKIINDEKNTGEYNYVKLFIMNIIDIEAGIYDLEGGSEAIFEKVKELHERFVYQYYGMDNKL